MEKPEIESWVVLGDSLSDRGAMAHRKLWDLIPMKRLAGLKDSPDGRFTNGYVWDDEFSTNEIEQSMISKQTGLARRPSFLADEVIVHAPHIEKELKEGFTLDNNRAMEYEDHSFLRCFAEGGMSAYNYKRKITFNLSLFLIRQVVATLDQKRHLLLQDDITRGITLAQKQKILVIEWSGANDLIKVNESPTLLEATHAIDARIKNLKILIEHGYRHFMLFNLPDLSLTPRYQRKSPEENQNAHAVSVEYNTRLATCINEIKQEYPDCVIELFDINNAFTEIYNHPETYGFSSDKKNIPFMESPDFKTKEDGIKHAPGYIYWDDVHPTATVHAILGNRFYDEFEKKFVFKAHAENLITTFKSLYAEQLETERKSLWRFFPFFQRETAFNYRDEHLTLETIFHFALKENDTRVRTVLTQLGWLDKGGRIITHQPKIIEAYANTLREKEALMAAQ